MRNVLLGCMEETRPLQQNHLQYQTLISDERKREIFIKKDNITIIICYYDSMKKSVGVVNFRLSLVC